jgi:hypothetical protein
MSLCICGHPQKEHLSSDGLDNPCQVDACGCSNYVTLIKEQKERLAQLGWGGGTDTQDSSESDTSTQETARDVHQAAKKLEGEAAEVYKHKVKTSANENARPKTDAIKQDEKISACFKRAKQNLNGLLKSKKQVIRDLAKELERLGRRRDHIAGEIVDGLHGCKEISKSLIYSYLDNNYKDQTQAQRRKGKKKPVPETGTEPATRQEQEAIIPPLVIKTSVSGQEVVESTPESQAKTQEVGGGSGSDINTDTPLPQPKQSVNTKPGTDSTMPQPQRSETSTALVAETTTEEGAMDKSQPTEVEYSLPIDEVLEYLGLASKNKDEEQDRDKFWFRVKLDRPATIVDIRLGRLNEREGT